ncbi:DUF4331 domain-containing protein [Sporichthya sp.]|uniref:DUF4331 domain-containing protein n=1 Tax=Sporichthya sp. TaxID=65475 RepID=UPI001799E013|nr:DUF4331 domain-containing protein [Sporichthya sp.]MBA3742273.1 DUF4331 domain-containing protein [Sporichthya sp.]
MNSQPPSRRRRLRTAGALGLTGVLAVSGLTLLGGQPGTASSHREAPLISNDPQADNTDTYAFVSPDKTNSVTLLANWIPFQDPNGGPNFYPFAEDARYNIKVDNSGDGVADITYQWTFRNIDKRGNTTFLYNNGPVGSLGDKNLLFKQKYTLTKITASGSKVLVNNGTAAPSFTGKASMPNYNKLRAQATRKFDKGTEGGKTYAGGADDSFALDLRLFDLLYGTTLKETGQDSLKGYNVNTLAIQVPKRQLALKGDSKRNPVIGVWSTTDRKTASVTTNSVVPSGSSGDSDSEESCNVAIGPLCPLGSTSKSVAGTGAQSATESGWTQVSRLGNPLVNEVVTAAGMKDQFNRTDPSQDQNWPALVERVTSPEVPKLIQSIYGLKAPKGPRNDLVQIFLTGIAKGNGPINADLNAHTLNKDASNIAPAEMLRLNMKVPVTWNPNRLGVLAGDLQGFPNGRRLTDDVLDIALQALEGAAKSGKLVKALAAGDGVNSNSRSYTRHFPYIAAPNENAVNQ